jgi:hypothetical protein
VDWVRVDSERPSFRSCSPPAALRPRLPMNGPGVPQPGSEVADAAAPPRTGCPRAMLSAAGSSTGTHGAGACDRHGLHPATGWAATGRTQHGAGGGGGTPGPWAGIARQVNRCGAKAPGRLLPLTGKQMNIRIFKSLMPPGMNHVGSAGPGLGRSGGAS